MIAARSAAAKSAPRGRKVSACPDHIRQVGNATAVEIGPEWHYHFRLPERRLGPGEAPRTPCLENHDQAQIKTAGMIHRRSSALERAKGAAPRTEPANASTTEVISASRPGMITAWLR